MTSHLTPARLRAGLSAALSLSLALASAGPAAAQPTRISFEGRMYLCSFTDGHEWFAGNVYHFRGATNHNRWVTGHPLLDGFADNVVNGDINVKQGLVIAHPRETVKPDAFDGTWEIQVTVRIGPDGQSASGVGRGTGELRGMTIFFRALGGVELSPGENPCSDIPFAGLIEGEILVPR